MAYVGDRKSKPPTEEELERRRLVYVNKETVTNTVSTDFPGHYPGEDHSWNLEKFRQNLKIQFYKNKPLEAEFDVIGIDTSIANAFRRILLAEVPSLAIEHVYITNNTSVIQDEVLAHRLGLIPLKGNREAVRKMEWYQSPGEGIPENHRAEDTICLALKVSCERNPKANPKETDPSKLFINSSVYAHQIEFLPASEKQAADFSNDPIRPANPDILVAKMRPGQEIDVIMHAVKGVGKDHAKFSPVATASYRLMPVINIKKPIVGEAAERFAKCFPKGVIKVKTNSRGEKIAEVENARADTVSREVLRHDEFKDSVQLARVRDHFIFSVESTGMNDSDELFIHAVQILKKKCWRLREKLDMMNQDD